MPNRNNRKKKETAQEKIVRKYAMSPETISKHEEKIEKTKAKYSIDMAEVEKNLTEFLEVKDPIVVKGKAIMWVKRPSMKELKSIIPQELRPYVDDPASVPEEVNERYETHFYAKMAELVAVPKRTAEQWEATANPWVIRLFWHHIANIAQSLEGNIEGF